MLDDAYGLILKVQALYIFKRIGTVYIHSFVNEAPALDCIREVEDNFRSRSEAQRDGVAYSPEEVEAARLANGLPQPITIF